MNDIKYTMREMLFEFMRDVDKDEVRSRIAVYKTGAYLQCGVSIPGGMVSLEIEVPSIDNPSFTVRVWTWDENPDHNNMEISLIDVGTDSAPWFTVAQRLAVNKGIIDLMSTPIKATSEWQVTVEMRDRLKKILVDLAKREAPKKKSSN